MSKNSKFKKRKLIGIKELIVIVMAIVLTTMGIKATDSLFTPNTEEGQNSFCPEGMARVVSSDGDFCIDIYEASAGEKCLFSAPTSQSETRANLSEKNCSAVSVPGVLPWRYISQDQAARACASAGKRLANNKEWLQAALGTPDIVNNWSADDCQVANNWPDQPGRTGSGKECKSFAGVYDMIGNLWEWVEGAVVDGKYEGQELPAAGYINSNNGESMPGITNPDKPDENYNNDYFWIKNKGLRGIVRGGYWNNKSDAGVYAVYSVVPPSAVEAGIGFRCVK